MRNKHYFNMSKKQAAKTLAALKAAEPGLARTRASITMTGSAVPSSVIKSLEAATASNAAWAAWRRAAVRAKAACAAAEARALTWSAEDCAQAASASCGHDEFIEDPSVPV